MESGAKGCTVIVSGKLRGQRAKSMKFVDGLMIHAGNPAREYIDSAVTHVHLRQGKYIIINNLILINYSLGVLGIKVKIMLPHDATGKMGPKKPLPDQVSVIEPKEEHEYPEPYSEPKNTKPGYDHV